MPQEEPLTGEELERLERRDRQLTWVHAAGFGVVLLAGVAAAVVQLRERCPRCGARLRRKLLVAGPAGKLRDLRRRSLAPAGGRYLTCRFLTVTRA